MMRAIPILLVTFPVVRLIPLIDARWLVGAGFMILALANALQGLVTTSQASFWSFAFPLILSGAGSAILYVPLTTAVLGATTREEGPSASAFMTLSTQLGGSIAVAMLDVLINQRESFHSLMLGSEVTLRRLASQPLISHLSAPQLAALVYRQSVIMSYADATYAVAWMALISVPLVLLLRKKKAVPEEHLELELGA
jgi:DHA2 family multidrug resistance protein